jgi:hypothetical protein
MWLYALLTHAVDQRLDPDYLCGLTRTYAISAVLQVVAVALSFVDWRLGLALAAAVTLYNLRAPPWPIYDQGPGAGPNPAIDQT